MTSQKRPPLKEAEFQDLVIDTARAYGWHVAHFRPARTANGYRTPLQGDAGFPDLVLARDGTVICAELKSDKGTVQQAQTAWLGSLGPYGRLWRPADWDDIVAELGKGKQ